MSRGSEYSKLRVEPDPPEAPAAPAQSRTVVQSGPLAQAPQSVDEWRRNAVQTASRLEIAEAQLKDMRKAADENRARATKYKTRLDSANERLNELQAQLVSVSAERDELRDRVSRQEIVKRKVYEYRQSLLDGPLWELFAEL